MRSELFKDYLDSVISQGLSKKQKAEIRREFECHLEDKTDWYMDIGYSEDEAAKKAVAEMGDSDEVREEIYQIHHTNGLFTFLLYPLLIIGLLILNSFLCDSFMHWVIDNSVTPTLVTVILSFIYLNLIVIGLYYCKKKRNSRLLGFLAVYFIIADLALYPFATVFSSIAQPALYALLTNVNLLFGKYFYSMDDGYIWAVVHYTFFSLCSVYCIFFAKKLQKAPIYKKSVKRKTGNRLKVLASLTICISFALTAGYYYVSTTRGSHQCLAPTDKYLMKTCPPSYDAKVQFDKIALGMKMDDVEKLLGIENSADKLQYESYQAAEDKELLEHTMDYKIYHFVKDPSPILDKDKEYYMVEMECRFDSSGFLFCKEYHAYSDLNNWLTIKRKSIPPIIDSFKEGMKRETVLSIINEGGLHPTDVTVMNLNGKITEEYLFSINIVNGHGEWYEPLYLVFNGNILTNIDTTDEENG